MKEGYFFPFVKEHVGMLQPWTLGEISPLIEIDLYACSLRRLLFYLDLCAMLQC